MSTAAQDSSHTGETSGKRRAVRGRACDICRQKKVRCDYVIKGGPKCSNCIAFNEDCTFNQPPPKKHFAPYPKGYVERLQERISQVEQLLHKVKPDVVFSDEPQDILAAEESLLSDDDSISDAEDDEESSLTYLVPPSLTFPPSDSTDGCDSCDDELFRELSGALAHLSNDSGADPLHFFGSSSPFLILQNALDMRNFIGLAPLQITSTIASSGQPVCRCPFSCNIHPWSFSGSARLHVRELSFPPPDLLASLVELYFIFYNTYLPVLHRQTFLQAVSASLHLHDDGFGAVVLLVCALGSKVSDDPRVLLEAHISDGWHSAGWKWFRQIDIGEEALFARATLFDVQIACLSAIFLKNTSSPDSSHICTGLGLRLAQNMGAQSRRTYRGMPRIDEELLKRVFWILVFLDWSYSSAVGRPSGICREDIDLDLPSDCDDEYWLHPDLRVAFRQPPGVPSKVAFFNCLLRLSQIHAFAYRTLYSSPKARAAMKVVNPEWEQRVVAELDAALINWFHDIPLHLQWEPYNPSIIFLSQSATLYAAYYSLQIAIHRPFIIYPLTSKESSQASSLSICTTAAKGCVCVLDKLSQRTTALMATVICDNLISLFVAGIVLLIGVRREKELSGPSADMEEEIAEVRHIMDILKATESRWHSAGRIWDMLHAVAAIGEIPMSPPMSPPHYENVSSEQAIEELWLQSRLSKNIGKRMGGRSLIYHHPIGSSIVAIEEGLRAPPPSPYNPHLGVSPAVTFDRRGMQRENQ